MSISSSVKLPIGSSFALHLFPSTGDLIPVHTYAPLRLIAFFAFLPAARCCTSTRTTTSKSPMLIAPAPIHIDNDLQLNRGAPTPFSSAEIDVTLDSGALEFLTVE